MAFQDDQPYPYRPNPWFAWMAPVLRAPGSLILWRNNKKPILYFVSPEDYWHAPPAIPDRTLDPPVRAGGRTGWEGCAGGLARMPGARVLDRRTCAASRRTGPITPDSCCWNWSSFAAASRPMKCLPAGKPRGSGVAGHLAAERAFRPGGSELDIHLAFLAASRQMRSGTALRQHRGAERTRGHAALPAARQPDHRRSIIPC